MFHFIPHYNLVLCNNMESIKFFITRFYNAVGYYLITKLMFNLECNKLLWYFKVYSRKIKKTIILSTFNPGCYSTIVIALAVGPSITANPSTTFSYSYKILEGTKMSFLLGGRQSCAGEHCWAWEMQTRFQYPLYPSGYFCVVHRSYNCTQPCWDPSESENML